MAQYDSRYRPAMAQNYAQNQGALPPVMQLALLLHGLGLGGQQEEPLGGQQQMSEQLQLPPPLGQRRPSNLISLPHPLMRAPRRAVRRPAPELGRSAAPYGVPRVRPQGPARSQLLKHLREQVPMIRRSVRGY